MFDTVMAWIRNGTRSAPHLMWSMRVTPGCVPRARTQWAMHSASRWPCDWRRNAGPTAGRCIASSASSSNRPTAPTIPNCPQAPSSPNCCGSACASPPPKSRRRCRIAARIRPRRTLTGPQLPPELPQLAAAVEDGEVDDDHIAAVCKALDVLPSAVPEDKKEVSERILVRHAKESGRQIRHTHRPGHRRPPQPRRPVRRERPRPPPWTETCPQGPDGMSRLSGWVDPELRAYLEAVNAAVRPGRHQPDSDEHEEVQPDPRSAPQRLHDAVKLGLRAGISSGEFGQHRGLPVTVIVTTTLNELNQAAHAINDPTIAMPPPARTGGGGSLPMRDLIRMAANSIHYLAVFEDHTNRPLYLGRTKRVASADQRIICYARDRGCTRPDCTRARLSLRSPPRPAVGRGRPHRCRLPVLRLRTRPHPTEQGPSADQSHRHRQTRMDRRHRPTRDQPRPPPRRTTRRTLRRRRSRTNGGAATADSRRRPRRPGRPDRAPRRGPRPAARPGR